MSHRTKSPILSKRLSLATKPNPKKLLKTALKGLITLWALYYVFSHIDRVELLKTLKIADIGWLIAAFVAFNASKIVSAIRLNYYFRAIDITLAETANISLYYLGMFYNLFLPGGIGGDGYKAYLLQKRYAVGYKRLIGSLLLDRISGVVALLFFAGVLFFYSHFVALYEFLPPLVALGILLTIPLNYLLTRKFFAEFMGVFGITTLYAFVVQLLQLASALFIVLALPIETLYTIDYLTLFLISSIVAVLPISIGGIGVRELTFLYGFALIGGDTTMAVTFSLLFFVITAISSLMGAFIKIRF